MRHSFWSRPIPRWAKWSLLGGGGAILVSALIVLALWIHFHRTYERWLNTPPEHLVGYPTRLITGGQVLPAPAADETASEIDTALIAQRDDLASVAEMSRSDLLVYPMLGLAYVKVFLHTRSPDGSADQQIEYVSEFRRQSGTWRHRETRNLALP